MAYLRKSYGYAQNGRQTAFNGHIKRETAIKRAFQSVTLVIFDTSGKGRGETKRFYWPDFEGMKG